MYFKKLELFGFKSFADKTLIEFEAGVTAIVGPNGCGKSNISDAIRWVLGEQSAKSLRGSGMEDVIFSGSSAKEPLNFAEVTLTLSNESKILPIAYDEVAITRRLYRSGESEYLINKNPMRLRDISELLMGTGIGTDGYSIIEQGKMDIILNARPEDRREIFEEAAGITKFKSKKKEALRKLEQTDANLLRVNDIIVEVKRQIGSIERQAKKAASYKVEFEKLKHLELGVASREFLLFEDRRRAKEDVLGALKDQEREFLAFVEELESKCEEEAEGIARLDEALRAAETEGMAISAETRKNQDRALLNRERIGELAERRENILQQIAVARRRLEEFSLEFDDLSNEFEAVAKEEADGQVFLSGVEAAFAAIEQARGSFEAEQEALRASLVEIGHERADFQNQLTKAQAERVSLEATAQRIAQDQASVSAEEKRISAELERVAAQVQSDENALAGGLAEKQRVQSRLDAIAVTLKEKEDALARLTPEESALRSKADFLKDLSARHEGFLGGVKALLSERQTNPAGLPMIGLLADLVRVEKGYELAVEAALESCLQAVVFKTDQDVLSAADFLRPLKKGRALLLSLDYQAPTRPSLNHGTRSILDFIHPDASIKDLLGKLIGHIYIADTPRQAFDISRSNPDVVCVTHDGERFEGQVVMGGSLSEGEESTPVGRESRIREVEEEVRDFAHRVGETREAIAKAKADEAEAEAGLKVLDETLLKAQVELADKKSKLWHIVEEEKKVSGELTSISRELDSVTADEQRLMQAEKAIEQRWAAFGGEETAITEKLASLDVQAREKAQEKEALLVRLVETRAQQGHCTAKREKIEKDKNWVLESKSNEWNQLLILDRQTEEGNNKKEVLEKENEALETEIEKLAVARDQTLRKVEEIRRDRQMRLEDLDVVRRDRAQKQEFLNTARQKAHAFELESTELRFEIDRLKERIFNAYQVDLVVQQGMAMDQAAAAAMLDADGVFDIGQAKAEIAAQKDKLHKMGPVNLGAVEEHDEMKERHDFLTQQQQDLVQAKEDLHKAILKINRTTKELFVETFAKIQKNFTEYYRLLFGGGSAELLLLDQEDVLESGIEIVARPPGKKLQSITLLSGGEKALTATALLFALFKVKPSPFCVLDEIDAPLDEINVERFCNVLREFIVGSQFIIITHNKRTMNLADALYGITMAQEGISKVVSVRFSDKKVKDKQEVTV